MSFFGRFRSSLVVAATFALASSLAAQSQPKPSQGRTVTVAPVVEEEEPVRTGKPGAPVVEEEEPIKPAGKPGAPVVEEEAPIKPSRPGAPVVEEEEPVKPAAGKSGAPVVEEETPAAGQTAQSGAPKVAEEPADEPAQDLLLQAPSAIALPRLDLRLFADVGYVRGKTQGAAATDGGFNIGSFDIFASSKLSDKVSVLVEALFERRGAATAVSLERTVLRYRQNKYLNFDMGRYHSAVSYYISTYHHGRWFETSAKRPLITGGILPNHGVGLQISGAMPSPESLPLSYFVELTNGRGFANGLNDVQDVNDGDSFKAVNIGFVAKPTSVPGLQLGSSIYNDRPRPSVDTQWQERIYSFHAVYQRGSIQFLNEFVHLRHRPLVAGQAPAADQRVGETSVTGLYSQFGYRIGKIVPFTRFDWLNAPAANPIARSTYRNAGGVRKEFAGGFFFDLSSFSALKLHLDRGSVNGLMRNEAIVQLAFVF